MSGDVSDPDYREAWENVRAALAAAALETAAKRDVAAVAADVSVLAELVLLMLNAVRTGKTVSLDTATRVERIVSTATARGTNSPVVGRAPAEGAGELMTPTPLACCDCSRGVVFTPHEQTFFARQGWPAPVRCYQCRRERARRRGDRGEQPEWRKDVSRRERVHRIDQGW
jgi:hypothetical protein